MDLSTWIPLFSEWLGVIAVTMIASASPALKKIRRVEYMFTRRGFNYALFIFAVEFVLAFQYFSNSFFAPWRAFADQFAGGATAERALLALICLVPFVIALVARKQPWKAIGWNQPNLRAALSVGFLLALLTIFLTGKFMTVIKGVSKEQAGALGIFLLLAIAEETIFRGYIQGRMQSFLGQRWGWLVTGVMYALWQLPGRLWVMPSASMWVIVLISLVQGLICGYVMDKTGHVAAPILYRAFSLWMSVF
jgi:membrane protease YdiL (CAAX protease family)